MSATCRPLFAAAALIAALAACDDPYAIKAQLPVVADTIVLYTINEAPVGAPTAVYLFGAATNRPEAVASAGLGFDFAVDVTSSGSVMLIPPRVLGALIPDPFRPPHAVGFQIVPESFEALTRAPASGYRYDSTLVVTPGQTVAVQSVDPVACPSIYLGRVIYSKVVVDSVGNDPTRVFLRTTVDPNCDFRSLVPGVPEN